MAKKSSRPTPAKGKGAEENENIDLNNPEFIKAWELLQHTRQSIFLTGKAGTGKSTFLRYITSHTRKKFVVLAPTGIAAVNVGGSTLHSFFRLPFKPFSPKDPDFDPKVIKKRMKYSNALIKLLRNLDVIIIDEISMVRADTIDLIDLLLRTYTDNRREPFGGKQLLLVGDIFQLEPVVTPDMREILRAAGYDNHFFFSAKAFAHLRLIPIELRKIYRQTEEDFVGLLDRIRMGSTAREDIDRLNTRCIPRPLLDSLDDQPDATPTMTLASRRDIVDHINETRLKAIDRPLVTFMGEIKGDFPENSLPTDFELSLKEGAQVVFIKNSASKLWVNGTIGTVETLTADILEVRLENGTILNVTPEKWSNIRYHFDQKTNKVTEEEIGSFTQYPVKLAWALTIHKSQGLTFNNVIIDMGHGAFTGGQTYVALSRCRSFEGLKLRSTVADRDIFVNPSILAFSRQFNDELLIDDALRKAHADECYHSALTKADSGDLTAAFDLFIEGLRTHSILDNAPAMRLARRKLAVVDTLRQRIDQLEAKIKADAERFSDMAAEYCSLGDDCRSDDMPLPAIANYDKALTLSPDHTRALYGRALAHLTIDDPKAAIADFERVLQLEPENFDALVRMGLAYHQLSDEHNAMDRCLVALALTESNEYPRPSLCSLHTLLADIYETIGDATSSAHHRKIAKRLRS